MRIVNWNLSRHAPDTPEAAVMIARIRNADPDLICLTKAYEDSLADFGGHQLSEAGASWGGERDGERKLVLWSRAPWRESVVLPGPNALGAAISAVTDTPLGPLRVVGVCTPGPFASPGGRLPRPPQWSMHIEFLATLGPMLKDLDRTTPIVIVGDLNQFVPLVWGSWAAHHAFNAAMRGFDILTHGDIAPIGEPTTSHVAVSGVLRAEAVRGIGRFDDAARAVSDQFGVDVTLAVGRIQVFD